MKNDLISIVVPIYNVEKYLNRCIDSIINQTYKNIEIILVDDGSIDNSKMICDEYSNLDNRIVVIHKENGGLSSARNTGIDIAKGKYITFIDSDDFIELDYIEYLYSLILKYDTYISVCKHNVFYNDDYKKPLINNIDYKISKEELLKDILYGKNYSVSACGKLYLKDLFKDIRYPIGKLFEDNDTTYKLIDKVSYIAIGFESKYNYMLRNDSITRKEFSNKHLYLIEAVDNMGNYLSKYDSLEKAIIRMRYWSRISTLNRMINSSNQDIKKEKELRKDLLKYIFILKDKNVSKKDKISFLLLKLGIRVYRESWYIYERIRAKKK